MTENQRLWNRRWYLKNKEKRLKYNKEYKETHKEETKTYRDAYTETHREYYRLAHRKWKKNNRDKCRIYDRKRRAKKVAVNENYTQVDEQYTKSLFNNVCVNCGSTQNLCIDHHYPLSKGHPLTRQNAVLLCNTCNCYKHDTLPEEFYTTDKLNYIKEKLNLSQV